ncbi:hypothetical protein EIKCOROL_00714 [Eikenella corrodens ATCC 23834]|uniref:Uncharacterized protein n=1 Tax=Eikenella corrodens ATCC 23834 TaxID=546274 RepID=C0DTN4_EIKCO|nr:hypothetical protein EIKCOROL_00714 [Eikenella corrodens ATCC 23834]
MKRKGYLEMVEPMFSGSLRYLTREMPYTKPPQATTSHKKETIWISIICSTKYWVPCSKAATK